MARPAAGQGLCRTAVIQVSPPDAQVGVGGTVGFFATAYDAGNNACASVTNFTWTSSNPRAASIDANGVARGLAPGVSIISARIGAGRRAKTGQATLQVVRAAGRSGIGCAALQREPEGSGEAVGLFVSSLRLVLIRGESQQLEFRAVRADGATAAPVCVVFLVDRGGQDVARVDSLGVVSAVGALGRAMVRLVVPGTMLRPREVQVEVRSDLPQFAAGEVTVRVGEMDTLPIVVPAEGNRPLGSPWQMFQFVSSDTLIARVSPIVPILLGTHPGQARITAISAALPEFSVLVTVRP